MKQYFEMTRMADDFTILVEVIEAWGTRHALDPKPSQSLRNHSPDGFEWGYGGSGPAQLALAILLSYTAQPVIAETYYQDFKQRFIETMPKAGGKITGEQIDEFLRSKL